MLIHFYIKFSSKYGESLHINIKSDDYTSVQTLPMIYHDASTWTVTVNAEELFLKNQLIYSIILQDAGGARELINNHIVDLKKNKKEVIEIVDEISGIELFDKVFNTAPFKRVFENQKQKARKDSDKDFNFIFKVIIPPLGEGKIPCITGSAKKLKSWKESKALHLNKREDGWSIRLNLSKEEFPIEYKFGIYDLDEKKLIEFEKGPNRIIGAPPEKNTLIILQASPEFLTGKWKGAGINVPVSSLRTEQTWGIGNFSSLMLLTDWAKKCGIKLIQLLPLNDTSATLTRKDSYPYAPISVFALHPLYLNIQKLATAFGVELSLETMEKIHELNELSYVDYEAVLELKMDTIRTLYDLEKQSFKDDFSWFEFFDLNRHWLVPYAAFCYLRDKYNTSDVAEWEEYKIYNEEQIQELVSIESEAYDSVAMYYFIQYHLHLQLKDATEYAHKNNIIIKGDLPIGVGRNSVDTWMYPHLFHLDMQAGAPPDAFTTKGQNWSFPTYNWKAMAKDEYAWWRRRMEHMGNYFDAVRIDHVLGFYRIWSIPLHCVEGILGRFDPAIPFSRQEFTDAGVDFNEQRLCSPYINDEELNHLFTDKAAWVKETFFDSGSFKKKYNTQRKISEYFNNEGINPETEERLFQLISNVILIHDEKLTDHFHFRINMYLTSSYKDLPADQKQKLDALYHKYFFEIQNQVWEQEGREKLTALRNCTNMLLCAEDLGMVPEMVEGMLNEMQILSLQVQRMPKTAGDNFSHPKNAAYLSVVTPSTHDMSSIREWWEDEKEHIQYFYNYLMAQPGEAPFHCEPSICREIILQHLQSPAMWTVFLMQDLFSINGLIRRKNPKEERINNPADPDHTWDYRIHITLEDLLQEKEFNNGVRQLIHNHGR